jgi:hypothetical protein
VFYNIILGALVVASNHWVLIGSNDLHRFWDVCYVGHADNIKKHLWLQHIVTSNVFHGYVILIAHDRRGDASQDPVGVSTGYAHFTSGNAILRILTVVWNSWLTPYLDLWSSSGFHIDFMTCGHIFTHTQNCQFWWVCQKWSNLHILGVPPKMTENAHFGGVHFGPQIWGIQFAKNPFRGAQLYGDTRQIIYCLDTRCGTPKPCFWCQNTSTRQNRGFWENRVFARFSHISPNRCIFV